MPFNGSGVFVRVYNWATDRANAIPVSADRVDAEDNGFAAGLSDTICRDGQSTITNDIPFANHKITGLGSATTRTDAANYGQVQDSAAQWSGVTAGTANAITISPTPAITAYAAGQTFRFTATAANTDAATIAVSGLSAKSLESSGNPLAANAIVSGATYEVTYDGTAFQLIGAISQTDPTFFNSLTITSTNASSDAFPIIDMYRDSATPASADLLGEMTWSGQNSTPAKVTYSFESTRLDDPAAGSEDATRLWGVTRAGSSAVRMALADGLLVGAATGGDKGAGTVNAAGLYVNGNQISQAPYITGLLPTAISGTSTTAAVTISAGSCTDSTGTQVLTGAGFSWAVSNGNAANGYDGGTTLPNSSTIHFFIMNGTSGTASFASTSLTPTLPTGYTFYRRMFSVPTNASGVLLLKSAIESYGGSIICYLTAQILDLNLTAPTASRSLKALTVPTGIKVQPIGRAGQVSNSAIYLIFTSPDEADVAPSTVMTTVPGYDSLGNTTLTGSTNGTVISPFLTTDTSGQIGYRANASGGSATYVTRGWVDFRRS